jgi:sortase A
MALLRSSPVRWPDRLPRLTREVIEEPADPRLVIVSYALTMLAVVIVALLVNVVVVGRIQHFTAQHRLYGELRLSLAEGSVPIGQTDVNGHLVTPGTPLALLSIPEIGVHEVVVEGTDSSETMKGVGHRRDTPLPGQPGASVLMGRAAAYGGVFGDLDKLQPGQEFTVQTGQGIATYRVIGPRTSTTMLPVLSSGQGRLTLTTASGAPYLPHGVLRVDADLVSPAFPAPAAVLAPNAIRGAEQALRGDSSHAFALSWLAELLILVVVAATWSWRRWHKLATWIVFAPAIGAVGLEVANLVSTLLPNLM